MATPPIDPDEGKQNHNQEKDQENRVMTQLLQIHHKQATAFAQQLLAPRTGNFKTFQSIHPPEFVGTAYPIKAKSWLKEIEKAFALAEVGKNKKTEYANFNLKDAANFNLKEAANFWWQSTKALQEYGINFMAEIFKMVLRIISTKVTARLVRTRVFGIKARMYVSSGV